MLKVVASAFDEAGFEVLGTATSGQAARNLSSEAEIGASRTLASLLWRLDHRQLSVSDKTLLICDEVGMTDDVDLVRLCAYVEEAGAKLILVGDHHQLGAVGPGGALGALVSRHPGAVHQLTENRRQHDPDERHALATLRDGEVSEAISFYLGHDRILVRADRADALQAAVDAWSADVADGHETAPLCLEAGERGRAERTGKVLDGVERTPVRTGVVLSRWQRLPRPGRGYLRCVYCH